MALKILVNFLNNDSLWTFIGSDKVDISIRKVIMAVGYI